MRGCKGASLCPQPRAVWGVCTLLGADLSLRAWLRRPPRFRQSNAQLDGAFLSTGPIHPGIRARHAQGVFFTGNIAGEAHPVIAEGISMAIQSSGLLAGLLIEGRAQDYAREWKHRFAPRIRAASLFAHLAMYDVTRTASLAALRALPGLLSLGARLSGKVPAAIHVSPEAAAGGPLAKVRDGDLIRLDAASETLQVLVDPQEWAARPLASMPEALRAANGVGMGRELFANMRRNALAAEQGACTWL